MENLVSLLSILPLPDPKQALSTRPGHGILTAHLHQDIRIAGEYRLQRRVGGGGFGDVFIGNGSR